jgi:uncharacterized protein YbjT (DUF2867 family)
MHVLITGTTGMVGEGVLHTCLAHPAITKVTLLNRKSVGVQHPKLTEVLHANFYDLAAVEEKLTGIDACFFCLGVSSVGMESEAYYKATYTLTMHVAETLLNLNAGMQFCYISGQGTDSSEKGRVAWARVKGKTENDLRKMSFKKVFAYRPGFILPMKGMKNTHPYYRYINWMYPIGKLVYANGFNTLEEIGLSMIAVCANGYDGFILNGKEISTTAKTLKNA